MSEEVQIERKQKALRSGQMIKSGETKHYLRISRRENEPIDLCDLDN
jgi:hypothetical protein